VHAATGYRGGKSGKIANNAPSERNHRVATLQPRFQNGFNDSP
jgi:hypothetical protein